MNASPQRPLGRSGQTNTIGALPVGGRPGTTQDFWDVGSVDMASQAPVQEFSEIVEVNSARGRGGSRTGVFLMLGILGLVVGWFAYETFVNQGDPVADLTDFIASLTGGEESTEITDQPTGKADEDPVAPQAAEATSEDPGEPSGSQPLAGNPYWVLPNAILGAKAPMARPWAPEEEETFRAGLAHHYTYQRLKTVMDIRERRLYGSDAVLWDALQDKKFWTRMFAAVGLAEFNVEVSLSTFEGALVGARSELVADFFERFQRQPTAAHLFVLRQVVRLLDEKGRLVVLQGINHSDDKLRDLYMAAATQDPSPRIQRWVAKVLRSRPIAAARATELQAVVDGKVDGDYLVKGAKAPKSGSSGPAMATPNVATEEELEKELKQFEDSEGDVEFYYDDPSAAVSDSSDPDTFEYDEGPEAKSK